MVGKLTDNTETQKTGRGQRISVRRNVQFVTVGGGRLSVMMWAHSTVYVVVWNGTDIEVA